MTPSRPFLLLFLLSAPLTAQAKWDGLAIRPTKPALDRDGDRLPPGALARLGTARWRHGGEVTALAYAPDGKTLASAGRDGIVRLWESSSGKELRFIRAHKGEARAIAFSPDSKLLASGGTDGVLQLWDANSGRALHTLRSGKDWINAVAFSFDGKLLASGDDSSTLRLWEVSSKREARALDVGHPVQGLAFTRDGKHLCVSGGEQNGVGLWPVAGGEKVRRFGTWPNSFCLTADSKAVVVGDHERALSLYEFDTAKPLRFLKDRQGDVRPRLPLVAAAQAGTNLAVGDADGFVRLFNAETGAQQWVGQGHPGGVKALALSPDGRTIASAGVDGSILHWSEGGQVLQPARGLSSPLVSVALSPDGKQVATATRDGTFRLWKADNGEQIDSLAETLKGCTGVAFSPDGKVLAASKRLGEIQLRDTATGKVIRTLKRHQGAIGSLAFTRDGKILLSGGQDRVVSFWDVETGEQRGTAGGFWHGRIEALVPGVDGKSVLLADGSATPRLLELKGEDRAEFEGHNGGCLAVALSPTGRVAASGGRDSMIRLWEIVSGKQRRALGGGAGWVHGLTWSRDGRLLASGHADGSVCLWDAHTGLRLRQFEGHRGVVLSLSFSADGKRLVSGGSDTTALVWDLSLLGPTTRPEPIQLSAEKLASLWKDLAAEDGPTAGEAIQALARAAEQSVALLREKVQPVREEDLKKLLEDLDSPRFTVRDRATLDLMALGRFIVPALREELRTRPTLEKRRRLEDILGVIERSGRSPEGIRALRGLELLEMLGTAAAKKLLQELAGGAAACDLTREAKAALQRLLNQSKDMP